MVEKLHLEIVHNFLHVRKIKGVFIDEASHIYIAMPMYILIEYSDNYSDTSGMMFQLIMLI